MHSNAQVCNSCADLSIPSDTVYANIEQNAMNVLSVRQCWWAHWKFKTTCPGHLVHRHIRLVTQVANTADKNTFQAKWLHFTGFDLVLAGLEQFLSLQSDNHISLTRVFITAAKLCLLAPYCFSLLSSSWLAWTRPRNVLISFFFKCRSIENT